MKASSVGDHGHRTHELGRDYATSQLMHVPVFDELLERAGLTRPWVAVALGIALYLLYVLGVYLNGFQQVFRQLDFWKSSLEPPAIFAYVLLVHRLLDVYGRRAVQSLRPVVTLDDRAFAELVTRMSATSLRYQWAAMLASSALSVLLLAKWEDWADGFRWSTLVATITSLRCTRCSSRW